MSNLVDTTVGPIAIGFALSTFFFGCITIQTHTYISGGHEDPRALRMLVVAVWFIELGHQIGLTQTVWWLMVENYGKVFVLVTERCPISTSIYILFHGLASCLVSSFFIYRLRKVTQRTVIPILLSLLLAARTGGNIALSAYSRIRLSAADLVERSRHLLLACWILAAALDVFLAVALAWDLYLRRRTSSYQTANIIDRIVLWTVATGIITSMAAVATLVLFVVIPGTNLIWLAMYIPMPRFFALSLLTSLNGRRRMRAQRSKVQTLETLGGTGVKPSPSSVTMEMKSSATWDSETDFNHERGII